MKTLAKKIFQILNTPIPLPSKIQKWVPQSKASSLPALKPVKNRQGVALLIAIACLMLVMYFAVEISYESNIEYLINAQNVQKVKAYYAAKSGVQISLLRIKTFQKAKAALGAIQGAPTQMLDQIWQLPFSWPLPVPADLNAVDKDTIKALTTESTMDAKYFTTIEDEGSKIDINDLSSPSQVLRKKTEQALLNVFEQKKLTDRKFADEYSSIRFSELIHQIADFQSSVNSSANGGDKRAAYSELNSQSQSDYYPPNRPFRTVAELQLVPMMKPEFYQMLEPLVTVHGMKGINPNLASKEVLKSLDQNMDDETLDAIIARRSDPRQGPFKNDQDFIGFVRSKNSRIGQDLDKVPLTYESVINFKIVSTGSFNRSSREITAIVVDLDKVATKVKEYTDKEIQANNPGAPSPTPTPAKAPAPPTSSRGAPRVVYWNEK